MMCRIPSGRCQRDRRQSERLDEREDVVHKFFFFQLRDFVKLLCFRSGSVHELP